METDVVAQNQLEALGFAQSRSNREQAAGGCPATPPDSELYDTDDVVIPAMKPIPALGGVANAPYVTLKKEKPEHRMCAFLKAQGMSNISIGARMKYTPQMVSMIVRQPWAQEIILQTIHDNGGNAVRQLLEGAAEDSVLTLISERDNESAKPSERISASRELLDRYLGKPTQRVETQKLPDATSVSELDREIAELEAEQRRLQGAKN